MGVNTTSTHSCKARDISATLASPTERGASTFSTCSAYQCSLTLTFLDAAPAWTWCTSTQVSASGKTSFCLWGFSRTDLCRSTMVFTNCSPRTHCWVLELFSSAVWARALWLIFVYRRGSSEVFHPATLTSLSPPSPARPPLVWRPCCWDMLV